MLEKIWEKTEFFTKFKDDNFLIESRTKDPLDTRNDDRRISPTEKTEGRSRNHSF